MLESEVEAVDQTNQLKARIETKCKALPQQERSTTSRESLISFQDLDDFPLVVQQREFEVRWRQTNALYFFTDGIPAYIVDEEVFIQWSSAASPDVPQAFGCSDTTPLATYRALMLSLAPFDQVNSATGKVLPDIDEKKVFSAVVVFVHPSQKLSSIEEAVDMLLVISHDPKSVPATALCRLPQRSIGEFYPCPTNDAALVLPFSMGQDGPILHLSIRHTASLLMGPSIWSCCGTAPTIQS